MHITREVVAGKLRDYLQHRITLDELVDWAERAMMDGEFEEEHLEMLRDIVARLGLADVRALALITSSIGRKLFQVLDGGEP